MGVCFLLEGAESLGTSTGAPRFPVGLLVDDTAAAGCLAKRGVCLVLSGVCFLVGADEAVAAAAGTFDGVTSSFFSFDSFGSFGSFGFAVKKPLSDDCMGSWSAPRLTLLRVARNAIFGFLFDQGGFGVNPSRHTSSTSHSTYGLLSSAERGPAAAMSANNRRISKQLAQNFRMCGLQLRPDAMERIRGILASDANWEQKLKKLMQKLETAKRAFLPTAYARLLHKPSHIATTRHHAPPPANNAPPRKRHHSSKRPHASAITQAPPRKRHHASAPTQAPPRKRPLTRPHTRTLPTRQDTCTHTLPAPLPPPAQSTEALSTPLRSKALSPL